MSYVWRGSSDNYNKLSKNYKYQQNDLFMFIRHNFNLIILLSFIKGFFEDKQYLKYKIEIVYNLMFKQAHKSQNTTKCKCHLLQNPYSFLEWTSQQCPFVPSRKYKKSKYPYEILQILVCTCGKQVGQQIYSSDRMIGYWRSNNCKRACQQLTKLNSTLQSAMTQIVQTNLTLITILENQDQEQMKEIVNQRARSQKKGNKKKKSIVFGVD